MPLDQPDHTYAMTASRFVAAVLLGLAAQVCVAADVGDVIVVQGLTTAQRPGDNPRFLTKGDRLAEGEVISTSSRGFAIIGFKDGTRMTLRPGTIFTVEKFSHDAGEESAFMRLFKGGLRAITGLIGKRNPNGVQINTATATIGIRGTDFDARICGPECREEARRAKDQDAAKGEASTEPAGEVVARVARMVGNASAHDVKGHSRALTEGAPLYNGESVRTSGASHAVLTFRDETKISLNSNTAFRIDNFRYEATAEKPSSMVLRLLRGGLRAITGLIGKRSPQSVQYNTAVATIGIRGTGVDLYCEGVCADEGSAAATDGAAARGRNRAAPTVVFSPGRDDGLFVYTWDGSVEVRAGNQVLPVNAGETGFFDSARNQLQTLSQIPQFIRDNPVPRPDQIPTNAKNLFGTVQAPGDDPGLYVTVRDGHVVVRTDQSKIDLGRGETAFLGRDSKAPERLDSVPAILRNDPIPLPNEAGQRRGQTGALTGKDGKPGDEVCEM